MFRFDVYILLLILYSHRSFYCLVMYDNNCFTNVIGKKKERREKKRDDFFSSSFSFIIWIVVSKLNTRLSFCCPNKNGRNSFHVYCINEKRERERERVKKENHRSILVFASENRLNWEKERKKNKNERLFFFWPKEKEKWMGWLFAKCRIHILLTIWEKVKIWMIKFFYSFDKCSFFIRLSIGNLTGLGWNSQIDLLETFNAWWKLRLILHRISRLKIVFYYQ
jgi:hypothetical protein